MGGRERSETAKPTIYDVARRAGTSVSTVSRVVNGSSLVGEKTALVVNAAMRELGFVPRRIRRQAGRAVLNIVVFLPRASRPDAHLFYDATALFAGIQAGMGETRAHTIAVLSDETSPFEGKKLGDIDGCVFAFGTPSDAMRSLLEERDIPSVLINRSLAAFPSVLNDPHHGMTQLAGRILSARPGCTAAFLSVTPAAGVADARFYALARTDLNVGPDARRDYASVSAITRESVADLLGEGFDTLVCVNDLVAVAVLERLALLGVDVPGKVAVTGYDNAPVRALVSRDLTSVDLEVERLGEEASRILSEAIIERRHPEQHVAVPGQLIRGNTV